MKKISNKKVIIEEYWQNIIAKSIKKALDEILQKQSLLSEGIIPNYIRKTVKLTMDNNDGVDFSEDSYIKYKANGLTVFSIFKRTPLPDRRYDKDDDGNPFIYALKGINGWTFDVTDAEIVQYVRKFLKICHSIDQQYDVIVMVPSKNSINRRFMSVIYKIVGAREKIEDYFFKVKSNDVIYNLDTERIMQDYPNDSSQDYIEKVIIKALNNMGADFEAKKFPKEFLKYVNNVVDMNNAYSYQDSIRLFRGKRVLVLDDVFSTGKTISDCVRCIESFGPAKVDVITLLSRKMLE